MGGLRGTNVPVRSCTKNLRHPAKFIVRCCKPGGYVELVEAEMQLFSDDDSYTPDTELHHYFTALLNAAEHAELVLPSLQLLMDCLKSAGFVHVQVIPFDLYLSLSQLVQ